MTFTPRLRHPRHRAFSRTARQDRIRDFTAARATDLAATGADTVFTSNGDNTLSAVGHGYSVHDGPFTVASDTTLPTGLVAGELYWIESVPDVDTFTLTSVRGGPVTTISDAGAGVHTMTKAEIEEAMFEYCRQNPVEVVRDAADVDTL